MKFYHRSIALGVLLVLACSEDTQVEAYARENEWYKSESISLNVVGEYLAWSIVGEVKTEGLREIQVRSVSPGVETVFFSVVGEIPSGPIEQFGQPIDPEDMPWLLEPMPTHFDAKVVLIKAGGETKVLHIPLHFSAGAKRTLLEVYRKRNKKK